LGVIMTASVVVTEQPWDYVVFRNGEEFLLTLLSGGVCDIDYTVLLTRKEATDIQASPDCAAELVASLRSDIDALRSRALSIPVWPSEEK
jgi:hypothetical protein